LGFELHQGQAQTNAFDAIIAVDPIEKAAPQFAIAVQDHVIRGGLAVVFEDFGLVDGVAVAAALTPFDADQIGRGGEEFLELL
jgi:hypothetical protein